MLRSLGSKLKMFLSGHEKEVELLVTCKLAQFWLSLTARLKVEQPFEVMLASLWKISLLISALVWMPHEGLPNSLFT